jgi:phosphate transport system substrate-binding protein
MVKTGRAMSKQHIYSIIGAIVIVGILTTGCGSSPTPSGDANKPAGTVTTSDSAAELKGTVTVSGAWALYPMVVRWGEEFHELHPAVRFDISAGGAGKGMTDALAEAVDIGMVSRAIDPAEVEKGAFGIAVTKDAVFLAVNGDNPVWEELHQRGITRETLIGIYITGEITTWGQAVGRPEVTDPIHVFTRSDAAGAPAVWAEFLGKKQEDLLGVGVYGDPGLLEAVVKDALGIGYNNLNYAFDFVTALPVAGAVVVPIDSNENGQADPEEIVDTKEQAVNAVISGRYPSPPARDLYLVTKGKPEGLVSAFVRWVLVEGQEYVDEVGYVALPREKLDAELGKLE